MLNNDIEVDPEMLTELMRTAESDPTIGVVGPKCYFHADRERIWSAGGCLRFREAITSERGHREIDRGQFDRDVEVDYVNGTAILIRREAAIAAGTWDPVYFSNSDDADFCTRVRRAGFRCFYSHRARLWHMVALTLGGYVASRTFYSARSTAIYVRRYAGPRAWLTYLMWTAAALPLAFARELVRGNQAAVLAKLRGMIEGLRMELPDPPRLVLEGSRAARPRRVAE
jgi:GT2 family glycosyltransferase